MPPADLWALMEYCERVCVDSKSDTDTIIKYATILTEAAKELNSRINQLIIKE